MTPLRSLIPGEPLRWLSPPPRMGRYPRTCLGQRPAALLPETSAAEDWAVFAGAVRAREQDHAREREEWAQSIVALMALHEKELAEARAGYEASLAVVASAAELAREEAALTALDKVADALARFEARARKGDEVGAARMLCRWLRKASGCDRVGKRDPTGSHPPSL